MIYDSLKNLDNYQGLDPRIIRALALIRDTDFSNMPDGTYEVEGFDFRYMLQSYTADKENDKPEAHRDFLDIQYVFAGKELVGVGQLADMTQEVEANPDGDIWFYRGPLDHVTLEGDRFVVLFPNDAHAPCCMPPEGPTQVRKCVFKIRVNRG
jgi:YhcH/YjgK/YiaL family protein